MGPSPLEITQNEPKQPIRAHIGPGIIYWVKRYTSTGRVYYLRSPIYIYRGLYYGF
jgi:hypothetical protein